MKRIVALTLTLIMSMSLCGMTVLAQDEKTVNQEESDSMDISNWGFHLTKKTFEYALPYEIGTDSWFGAHDEFFASNNSVCEYLEYDEEKAPMVGGSAYSCEVTGEGFYNEYEENDEYYLVPGNHTLVITGEYPYKGTVRIPFVVRGFKMERDSLYSKVNKKNYTYSGKAKKPKCSFWWMSDYDSYIDLDNGKDYTVSYKYTNNKKIGTGKVKAVVKFKNKFSGTVTITKTFKICPKPTKITSVKAKRKTACVKFKKVKGVTGYRVRLYTSRNTLISTYTFKGNKWNHVEIKGLSRHKKYKVKTYTYKKVKGKKIFSSASKTKTFRTH